MKKRIISFLAMVAMLISMLSCIFIPAYAAAEDQKEAWKKVIQSLQDWDSSENTVAAAAVTAWKAADYATVKTTVKDGLAAGTLSWKAFDGETVKYPRYEYHEEFDSVGYDGKNWSISDPADWTAMDAYANAAEAGDYFAGVTFHLTTNVDFENAVMYPLGIQTTKEMTFAGTIDGHNYGFENINITTTSSAAPLDNTYFATGDGRINESIGLIGFLGNNCTIKNFGVNSGIIYGYTGRAGVSVSTFGTIPENATVNFSKVWSGATLRGAANPFITALAGLDTYYDGSATNYSTTSKVNVNGFTFYGKTLKSATSYKLIHGVVGGLSSAPAAGSTFTNIIAYPTTPAGLNTYLFGAGLSGLADYTISNVYGEKKADESVEGIGFKYDYRSEAGSTGYGGDGSNYLGNKSLEEVAWTFNSTQATAANPVYFTMVGENVLPTGTPATAVAKLTFTGYADKTIYVNGGTTYTIDDLAKEVGIDVAGITAVMIDGEPMDGTSYVVNGDATIEITVSDSELLNAAVTKYSALETKYLTEAAATALTEFKTAAAEAGEDAGKIQAALELEAALKTVLATYSTYPEAGGKEIPAYADNGVYGAYNTAKSWVIETPADWKAMSATADAAEEGATYLDGAIFHLNQDVDFADTEWLAPMGTGKYFGGTINGHGYGFNDLKIYEGKEADFNDAAYTASATEGATGMFHRLGNCSFIDFGVNSGYILRTNGDSKTSVTTFGGLKDGYKPSFTRVWSGATLRHIWTGNVSALAAAVDAVYTENVTVNGYVFDGKMSTVKRDGFSVIGTLNDERAMTGKLKYTNIIADSPLYTIPYESGKDAEFRIPQLNGENSLDAKAVNAPEEALATGFHSSLFGSFNTTQMDNSTFENIYAASGANVVSFFGRVDGGGAARTVDERMVIESALEAAWKVNKNPSEAAEPVFFTLKGDKIRPVAENTNMIVKVTLTGIKNEVYYLNANTEYSLAEDLNKKDLQSFNLPEGALSTIDGDKLTLGKEDLVIHVTTTCAHDGSLIAAGENAHTRTCETCGYNKAESCSAATATANAITEAQLAAGEPATHSGTCETCGEAFTAECTVNYVISEQANAESYWDYSDCVCGRENVEHQNTAPAMIGDTTGDSSINLIDAVRLLRSLVETSVEFKQGNADVNGDNAITIKDVRQIIRLWLGDAKTRTEFDAIEQYINAENHYDAESVSNQRLKMDGSAADTEGFIVTDAIAIGKGNTVAFGPVRLGNPVMGYFYDADNNPLQLIDHSKVTVEYTLDSGMAMVSITAPEGAKSIRIQLTDMEKDQFYVRINHAFSIQEYQKATKVELDAIVNPLKNMKVLTVGDSLCAAANDVRIDGLKGWARRIHTNFGANVTNYSQGGASLSTISFESAPTKPRQYILNQLLEQTVATDFDYILLEGGANDAAQTAPVGTINETSYDPADFDSETTMAGGMERLIYNAIKNNGETAAIGYMSLYKMPHSTKFSNADAHFAMAKKICEKWGIEYLNLYEELDETEFDSADLTNDYVHAIAEGYDVMQPHINAFLPRMRPVSQEIYNKVCEKKPIPEAKEGGGPLYSASENPYKESLKILAIGNSFSADATKHLWGIANSYGVEEVIIGNMSIGGCSLDTHYENITNNNNAYSYSKWTPEKGINHTSRSDTSIAYALADEDWDIITLQQASGENLVFDTEGNPYDPSGNPVDTYSKVDEILAYLDANKPKESTKVLWHMTWAYQSDSTHKAFAAYGNDQSVMYNALLDRAQELTATYDDFAGVLPSGTAIQNLRNTRVGDTVTRDGYHMSYGLGRYTVALTWYCYITGADPRDVTYIPEDYFSEIAIYRDEISQSVLDAIQNPYNK